ncbi:MAG TPA: hypothetical protein VMA77_05215 [Solirubrobacteraceae bacterium]|nr:hypothetical protein [Solirubrobacteraceae bacterium]
MRRAVIALVLALPLALGTATASAHNRGQGGWGSGPMGQRAAVAGTVTSVNATAGTFMANAYVLTPPSFTGFPPQRGGGPGYGHQYGGGQGQGWSGRLSPRSSSTMPPSPPTTTAVTISTGPNTKVLVNGKPSSVGALTMGDKFVALFSGSSSDTIQTLTASPALAVFAHTPPMPKQLYAFVGTVSMVSGTSSPGTLTVTITDSYPSGFFTSPATFTVGPNTLILGGNSASGNGLFGGTLSDVSMNDTVVGALVAPAGETATQVEAQPLAALLDFPASGGSMSAAAKASALDSTLAMFGVKHSTKPAGKRKHHHRHHHKKK